MTKSNKNEMKEDHKNKYNDLAPINTLSQDDTYIQALNWAFMNPSIKNIALTGAYGSGKSSILLSFLEQYENIRKKTLSISLASFIDKLQENQDNNSTEDKIIKLDINEIEKSILKQLFYKVAPSKIPQSRFQRIRTIEGKKIFLEIIAVTIFIFFCTYFFRPQYLDYLIDSINRGCQRIFPSLGEGLLTVVTCITFVGLIFWGIFYIERIVKKILISFHLKKVTIQGSIQAETGNDEESIFDKNMDEIIYFFESTRYTTIFFEDLDRLQNNRLFVHLRALNNMLNQCDVLERPIRFVYAVKDDIFEKEDRTKFFEFILPVIPIINATNSGEEIRRWVTDHNYGKIFDEDFIDDIAPYIEDMRVLQNIFNEYEIYREQIINRTGLNLDPKKLFAVIAFKNIYPSDFSDLQNEKGIVKQAFYEKEKILKQKIKDLNDLIEKEESTFKNLKDDELQSVNAIKSAMLADFTDWDGIAESIQVQSWKDNKRSNSSFFKFQEIMDVNFKLDELKNIDRCEIKLYGRNWITKSSLYEKVEKYYPIWKRHYEYDGKIEELKLEINTTRDKIKKYRNMTMKEILDYDENDVLSEQIKQNKLLVFLLRNGYLDETYASYINYFQANSTTYSDRNFILSVKNREPLPFDYRLVKISQVIKKLKIGDFDYPAVYNFDLLNEMLMHAESYEEKLEEFMKQLGKEDENSWNFIDEFVGYAQAPALFVKYLAHYWSNMWNFILDSSLLEQRKVFYLKLLIDDAKLDDLCLMNKSNSLSTYFRETHDILQKLHDVDEEKMIALMGRLQIKFSQAELTGVSETLVQYIIQQQMYILNPYMLNQIISWNFPQKENAALRENYTVILEADIKPVLEYIDDNIEEYVKNVTLSKENTQESNRAVVGLLTKIIDDKELCCDVIRHQGKIEFNDLADCNGEQTEKSKDSVKAIWDVILEENKVVASWSNVRVYWKHFGVTKNLVSFVDVNYAKLDKLDNEDDNSNFVVQFIKSDLVDVSLLKKIKFALVITDMGDIINKIPEDKVEVLVEKNVISFTLDNLQLLHDYLDDERIMAKFIVSNQDLFFAEISEDSEAVDYIVKDQNLILNLIYQGELSTKNKNKLIASIDADTIDIEIAKKIIELKLKINREQFYAIWDQVDQKLRVKLFYQYMELLTVDDFQDIFQQLKNQNLAFDKLAQREARKQVKLSNTPDNIKLAKCLRNKGYITSFNEIDTKIEMRIKKSQ
ncbi:YobI family P-loop NTPase [Megasphaera elsdenii]|uniref:YobI family P-loop NTPase n=1 Tax=Megasphaera elsdenii TaxID=907 RepID=UPI00265EBF88|nr:hypothetical protein [Megasphaera elsdenii]